MKGSDGKSVAFKVKKVKAGVAHIVHESGLQMQVDPTELSRHSAPRARPTERSGGTKAAPVDDSPIAVDEAGDEGTLPEAD